MPICIFYAEKASSSSPRSYLLEGDEIYDEIEDNYTDEEIREWAGESGRLDEEKGVFLRRWLHCDGEPSRSLVG